MRRQHLNRRLKHTTSSSRASTRGPPTGFTWTSPTCASLLRCRFRSTSFLGRGFPLDILQALRQSGLDYTIVRPGRLTNEPGRGRVRIAKRLPRGEIPRADVAAVLAEVLRSPVTVGRQFDVTSGEEEITEAIAEVAGNR